MIIEIKDLPENQLISKVDLHIDFQNGSVTKTVETQPNDEQPNDEQKKEAEIPSEMTNGDF